jgi:hypothetical protein
MNNSPLHSKAIDAENLLEVQIRNGWGNIECFHSKDQNYRIEVFAQKLTILSLFEWQPMTSSDFARLGFRIYREDERLIIRSEASNSNLLSTLLQFNRVHFRLYIPRKCSVDLQNHIGDIRINGLSGNHRYKSQFGSIYLDNIKGRISSAGKNLGRKVEINHCEGDLKLSSGGSNLSILHCSGNMDFNTDGGNIRILNYQGYLNCRTKGGNIRVVSFNGELKAASWGGNIKVEHLNGDLTANTMGGNVSLKARKIENYAWLQTSGGNIRFDFFENQRFDLSAKANRVKAKGNFTFQGNQSRTRWTGQVNGGGPDVRLKTSGGHIYMSGTPGKVPDIQQVSKSEVAVKPQKEPGVNREPKIFQNSRIHAAQAKKMISEPKIEQASKFWDNIPFFGQALLALVLITLLTYGFNTIIYFTKELFNPTSDHAEENRAIFYLNLINGLIAFVATWFFISVLNRRIQRNWKKYMVLSILTFVVYLITHGVLINLVRQGVEPGSVLFYYDIMVNHYGSQAQDKLANPRASGIIEALFFMSIPILAGCAFFAYYNRSQNMSERLGQQQLQLLNLEKLKTKAQLNALEARINPHFLYNSLNSIAGLIHENPDQAEDMTIELSRLFRATTGRKNESYHSIQEELELVKSYLAIEKMRFGERLSYEINVEPELNEHKIPRFLLQPLVENAIKHGISKIARDGEIKIDIGSQDEKIKITIHDNGPDFGEAMSGGYGLKSVQDKLDLIYEGKASLEIENSPTKQLTILMDKNHEL